MTDGAVIRIAVTVPDISLSIVHTDTPPNLSPEDSDCSFGMNDRGAYAVSLEAVVVGGAL